ncbi:MAG: hypothetical protein Q8Q39_02320 [bacterium]|nr:hypothetical protein [bacterium]
MFFIHRPSYIKRIFAAKDWARILVFAAFMLLGAGIAIGAYAGFLRGFHFFRQEAYFSQALYVYALEATFFIIAVLVFASAMVSGFFTLFASRENQFLLSAPLGHAKLFWSRFFENALMALWPVVLIGIPAVIALSRVQAMPFASHVLFWGTLAGVFFVSITLSSLIDLALIRVTPSVGAKSRTLFIGFSVMLCAWALGRIVLPIDLNELFYAESFVHPAAPTDLIFAHFRNMPTHAAVQFLFLPVTEALRSRAFFLIAALSASSVALLWYIARAVYVPALMRSFEGLFIARSQDTKRLGVGFKRFPSVLRGAFGALLEKDILGFMRSSRETSRAFFLLFMLFLYLFLYLILFRRFIRAGLEIPDDVLGRILFFNLAVIGYFVTTLSLRFAFPLISLEGRSAWAIFSSPMGRMRLFWEKLLIGIVPVVLAVVPLAIASALVLRLEGVGIAVFMRMILGVCVVIPTLSVAFGTVFPNFRDTDPDRLSTTMPGLILTALSFLYVAFASWIGFHSIRAYLFDGVLLPGILAPLILMNIAVVAVSLWVATRRLHRLDITA